MHETILENGRIFLTRHLKRHSSKTVGDINSKPILIDSSGNFASIYLFGSIFLKCLLFFKKFSWKRVPLKKWTKRSWRFSMFEAGQMSSKWAKKCYSCQILYSTCLWSKFLTSIGLFDQIQRMHFITLL